MAATHGGHLEVVRLLLDKSADINAVDQASRKYARLQAGGGIEQPHDTLLREGGAPERIQTSALQSYHRLAR